MASFAAGHRERCAVAWYALDDMDADPVVFLTHLIRTIFRAVPAFGSGAQKALSGILDVEKQAKMVAAAISEELWQTWGDEDKDLVLVLDDYHTLSTSQPVTEVIQYLLANAPTNVHFCIVSRSEIPLRTERLSLQGQVHHIGIEELSLEIDEIGDLLNRISEKSWDEKSVGQVAEATEGWAAGVVLIGQSSKQGWELRAKDPKAHDRESTFRYFAEEIFSRQEPALQEFLTGSALLRYLSPRAAEEILGVKGAATLLRSAVDKGLFLSRTETTAGEVYRFHQVFRAFLQRGLSTDEVQTLHRKAAAFYERESMLDEAMGHYLDAGLLAEAVSLLERTGLSLIESGRVDQLRHWLSALPKDAVEANPTLCYCIGFAYQNSDQTRAIECLDRAANMLSETGDLGLQVRALIYMATIYSLQNQTEKVKEVSSRIPVVTAMRKDSWARGVLTVSALCQAAWEDNLKRGVWLYRLARRLPLDPDWKWAMLAYACMIHYRLGDLETAQKLIEEGLALPVVKYNDNWLGLGLVLHHVTLYLQDKYDAGEPVREELWNLGEKYDSPYYKAYAERARAFMPYERGRFQQGREMLKSSLYFFEKAANAPMASLTRLDLALLETNLGNAAAVVGEAKDALSNLFSLNPGQGLEETGESIFGVICREAGDLKAAEEHLLRSAAVSRRKGAKQALAGTCLHLAELYSREGQDAQADRYLSEGLGLVARHRYRVFWDFHRPTLLRMCVRAMEHNIHPAYAEYLLSHWFGNEAADAVAIAAARVTGGRKAGIQAAAERLRSMAVPLTEIGGAAWEPPAEPVAGPEPVLEMNFFGNFEARIGGLALPEKAWQTRKVKTLFKYLVLNRSRRVSRDELMELLWPDADPETSAPSLRVTLSRLRRALGPKAAPFLGEERGFAWFEPARPHRLDIQEFEEAAAAGVTALKVGDRVRAEHYLANAISLYRGDLLEEDQYEDWPVSERERLQMTYLNALQSLAKMTSEGGTPDYGRVLELMNKALAVNPYREETYLALMQTHVSMGEVAEALRVYERCLKMLRDEFGVAPGREIEQFAARIRTAAH